ncbi:N-acetylmuramoyl-L-alanine amidase [Listeria sp. PSOL-1]|uniref:N-acetylmuramoyl-L-alanine amidase n=1 Tax=Listeria sp. PSOL-1 TaxID=1844999 RepID=UPI0013D1BAF2|nr:N-acetylmuramoyl-L-alanine amidase [Listeria sp. PSOL-1]
MTTIAMANANTVTVQAEVINVRSGPGLAYDVTHQVRKNTVLKVIGEENKWYKVRFKDGNTGFVASWLVKNTEVSAASNSIAVVTSSGGLNIRKKPTSDSERLGMLNTGDQINVVSEQNGWAQIQYKGQNAWVNASYIKIRESTTKASGSNLQKLTIRDNATNIRNKPNLNGSVIEKADSGQSYSIDGVQGDWYKITTTSGKEGYVANWVVDISSSKEAAPVEKSKTTSLSEATIVIDPGHGGHDPGAKGADETIEKKATLKTAKILAEKLRKSGTKVIMTRESDEYVSLKTRTNIAQEYHADVFVSLHFDSVEEDQKSVHGQTTYYYKNKDESLAESINQSLGKELPTSNRGARIGDFYVVRENTQPAVLLELGYLSSKSDEKKINSKSYREHVATAVYQGLSNYFAN